MALKPGGQRPLDDTPPIGRPAVSYSVVPYRTLPGNNTARRLIAPAGIRNTIGRVTIGYGPREPRPFGRPGMWVTFVATSIGPFLAAIRPGGYFPKPDYRLNGLID